MCSRFPLCLFFLCLQSLRFLFSQPLFNLFITQFLLKIASLDYIMTLRHFRNASVQPALNTVSIMVLPQLPVQQANIDPTGWLSATVVLSAYSFIILFFFFRQKKTDCIWLPSPQLRANNNNNKKQQKTRQKAAAAFSLPCFSTKPEEVTFRGLWCSQHGGGSVLRVTDNFNALMTKNSDVYNTITRTSADL